MTESATRKASVGDASASPTEALARFAAELRYDEIPASTVEHMKLSILDSTGCILFGSTLPWGNAVTELVDVLGSRGSASIWGTRHKVDPASSALANGTFGHGFELDESHLAAFFHPGSAALPAVVGVAEARGAGTGEQLLCALVAGYEVGIRVGMALGYGSSWRGFHQQGIVGGICGTAAVGNLIGLDVDQMRHALGTAASQGAGLLSAQFGAMVKRFHAGKAAQSAVYSALLSEKGFTGIPNVFEAETAGFLDVMSEAPRREKLTAGLGTVFETERVGYKPYACVGAAQASIWAVGQLMKEHQLGPRDIAHVKVRGNRHLQQHTFWEYEPNGVTAAQINLPYLLTVMIHEGDVFVEQFEEEKVNSPEYVAYSRRIEAVIDPVLQKNPPERQNHIILELTLQNGELLTKEVTGRRGMPENPLTREEITHKFHRLATKVLSEDQALELLKTVDRFEELGSVAEFSKSLVP